MCWFSARPRRGSIARATDVGGFPAAVFVLLHGEGLQVPVAEAARDEGRPCGGGIEDEVNPPFFGAGFSPPPTYLILWLVLPSSLVHFSGDHPCLDGPPSDTNQDDCRMEAKPRSPTDQGPLKPKAFWIRGEVDSDQCCDDEEKDREVDV